MSKYPDNWDKVRGKILRRAGGNADDPRVNARCEFCGVQNYSVGWRDERGIFHPVRGNAFLDDMVYSYSYTSARELVDEYNEWDDVKYIVIVLTIAHLGDDDPMNVSDNNLAALCQQCHNRHDVHQRCRSAARTRRCGLEEKGQEILL